MVVGPGGSVGPVPFVVIFSIVVVGAGVVGVVVVGPV